MATLGTYTLKHAIMLETKSAETGEVREQELKPAGFCVVVRRPKAKDLKVMDDFQAREIAGAMAMLERISTLDTIEIENLDAEDMAELGNLVGKAVEPSRPTGETA